MDDAVAILGDARVLRWAGPLGSERDAMDLIAASWQHDVEWIAVPAASLPPEFFQLKTGLAGGIVQKFVNYQVKLVIVGDIALQLERSTPLKDFVREANRGRQLWFADDEATFERRLSA